MESNFEATQNISFEDFEPLSKWRREVARDTLEIHLPEFKMEQLHVKVTKSGTLKVSGERPVDATLHSRFYKEYKVPTNCNSDEIDAKFVGGVLNIIMPKKIMVPPKPEQTTWFRQLQVGQNPNQNDQIVTPPNTGGNTASENAINLNYQKEISVSRLKRVAKVAMGVAIGVALVSALNAYIMYKYVQVYKC